jgi:thiosulfate/3-mercaptopyruvate sulfurtransferase
VYSALIETKSLAEILERSDLSIVDVRYDLSDHDAGRAKYFEGHIPGARYADLGTDLSDPPGGGRGRHPLPSIDRLAATLSKLGISNDSQVVAYDTADGMYASRLWWMLRYLGHDSVAVLNGGIAKWVAEGRPLTAEVPPTGGTVFVPNVRASMSLGIDEVREIGASPRQRLVDSRAPDRFRGENETLDPVAGHIPGATNRFFRLNVGSDGTFRDASALRHEFEALLAGTQPGDAVFYCGSGVTACHNLVAMAHAGLPVGRLYPGSWSEWCSDPSRPVALVEE